jgi:ABC-type nitrate/sulfonate/bicarbonate transport system substrate-binding protein
VGAAVRRLRLGCFSVSVVARVADATGLFTAYGLDVVDEPVASSVDQFRGLLDGDLDLVLTSPDNVLTYRVNATNPLRTIDDVRILCAVDWGLGLSLLASAGIDEVSSLHGRRIAVDVATSGYSYALVAILTRAGLRAGDYELVALGSTPRRADALRAGACDATLLNAGHDVIAERAGAVRIARVVEWLGRYPGSVLAARQSWLEQNADRAAAFGSAWQSAVAAALDPRSRQVVESLVADALRTGPDEASTVRRTLVSPEEGLVVDGRLDLASWERIVDLRQDAGGFDPGVDVDAVRANMPLATPPPC